MSEQIVPLGWIGLIGKRYDDVRDDIEKMSPTVRVWHPDTIGTMEVLSNRLNVFLDENGVVTKIDWG